MYFKTLLLRKALSPNFMLKMGGGVNTILN